MLGSIKVSWFSNHFDRTGEQVTAKQVVKRLISENTDTWRTVGDRDGRSAIAWSGVFSTRSKHNLVEHSGLVVIDWDDMPTPRVLLARLRDSPNTVLAFISPSGQGVKGVFAVNPVPENADQHEMAFHQLVDNMPEREYVDMSGFNVDRLCYVVHDPGIRPNWRANRFDWEAVTPEPSQRTSVTDMVESDLDRFNDSRSAVDFYQLLGSPRSKGNVPCPLSGHSGKGGELSIHDQDGRWLATSHCDKHPNFRSVNYVQLLAEVEHGGDFGRALFSVGITPSEAPSTMTEAPDLSTVPAQLAAIQPIDLRDGTIWEGFWSGLEGVWDYYASRLVSPWVGLGSVLARAVLLAEAPSGGDVPILWHLAATVGIPAPIGLYFAFVGEPGAGKSSGLGLATSFVEGNVQIGVDRITPASGEGLIEAFIGQDRTQKHWTGLLWFDELTRLFSTVNKEDSTLGAVLREAWSGGPLSTAAATKERRRRLDRYTYRISALAGAQPAAAREFLTDKDYGDVQRWLFLPAHTVVGEVLPEVDEGAKLRVTPWAPRWGASVNNVHVAGDIGEEVRLRRKHRLEGRKPPEQYWVDHGQHTDLLRLRCAAAYALVLGDEPKIERRHWLWAGALMTVSRQVLNTLRGGVKDG